MSVKRRNSIARYKQMKTSEICRDKDERRQQIRKHTNQAGVHDLNGIDYLEVDQKQTKLTVYFIGEAPTNISENNIRIDGGTRIRNISVIRIFRCDPKDPRVDGCLQVELDRPGDFSTYTLRLVKMDALGRPGNEPLEGFDPRYAQLDFSFKASCPTDLDCVSGSTCAAPLMDEPEIDYLSKDYNSFRQLILDRLSLIMPDWKESHVPDLGITLVELLAYTGDYLSYYQDAVATEAYLETARQRISVRRHAKLVDYQLHEGCNARAWVHVAVESDTPLDQIEDVYFISSGRSFDPVLMSDDLRDIPFSDYEVFEPVVQQPNQPLRFYEKHNNIRFYTWHDRECCLERGATSTTLIDEWADNNSAGGSKVAQQYAVPAPSRVLHLKPGDVLIFEELFGPVTGQPADADPLHRHVVRLTKVEPGVDPLYDQPILEIEWSEEDALPFPLCISAIGRAPECLYLTDISVAHGNVLLVDHGRRVGSTGIETPEWWTVPALDQDDAGCLAEGEPAETLLRAGKFQPQLKRKPLTHAAPFPTPSVVARQQFHLLSQLMTKVRAQVELPQHEEQLLSKKARRVRTLAARTRAGYVLEEFQEAELIEMFGLSLIEQIGIRGSQLLGPASRALIQDPREALPSVTLHEQKSDDGAQQQTRTWFPQLDLLESNGQDRGFVVEIDNDNRAQLRFGDGDRGRAPVPNSTLTASYRVGNGTRGNVGAEAIKHLVFRQRVSGVKATVRNPLPATGGIDPEPLAEAKLFAPMAFRGQLERAITRDDYAALAQQIAPVKVQQAAAAPLRWTGSWYEVEVAIDPVDSEELDRDLRELIEAGLHRYRRIGHDLRVQPAEYVPLDIKLLVCVLPHYQRAHVKAELLDRFSNRLLPAGKSGFFHPNNLSFGEGIYLSKLVAAAQDVAGVESVVVKRLQRLYESPNNEIENGVLPLSPLEVARLDNDRNFPEHGTLWLDVRGGR